MVFRKIDKQIKERSIWLRENDFDIEDVQDIMGVSSRSVYRWISHLEDYGSVIPPHNPLQGSQSTLTAEEMDHLLSFSRDHPEAYLDEIQLWAALEHDICLSVPRIDAILRSCGFTYKKLRQPAAERDEQLRSHFRDFCDANITASMIVAIDESFRDDKALYRRFGRAPSGQRATVSTPHERGTRWSIVLALTVDGYIAVRVVEDSVDTLEFIDFIANDVVSQKLPSNFINVFIRFYTVASHEPFPRTSQRPPHGQLLDSQMQCAPHHRHSNRLSPPLPPSLFT